MNIQELMRSPTCIGTIHESCFRSYSTLRYVEHLLERNTPPDVVLELLREINAFPPINTDDGQTAYKFNPVYDSPLRPAMDEAIGNVS